MLTVCLKKSKWLKRLFLLLHITTYYELSRTHFTVICLLQRKFKNTYHLFLVNPVHLLSPNEEKEEQMVGKDRHKMAPLELARS